MSVAPIKYQHDGIVEVAVLAAIVVAIKREELEEVLL